jgi:hypothetical protein
VLHAQQFFHRRHHLPLAQPLLAQVDQAPAAGARLPRGRAVGQLDGLHPLANRHGGVVPGGLEEVGAEEVVGAAEGVVGGGVEAEDGDALGDSREDRALERVGERERLEACEGGMGEELAGERATWVTGRCGVLA